jgi:uncharacterized membrane protein
MGSIVAWMAFQFLVPFDPYPYILLALFLGIFTLFLDNVILIANKHQTESQDRTLKLLVNMAKSQIESMKSQKEILEYILLCERLQMESEFKTSQDSSSPQENP